jgi:hypothetical protein
MQTAVYFIVWQERVLAVFPGEDSYYSEFTLCYDRELGHMPKKLEDLIKESRPASYEEYIQLANHLIHEVGYHLEIKELSDYVKSEPTGVTRI